MGRLVTVSCHACGGRWQCRVGHGMMHGRFAAAAEAFPEEQRSGILASCEAGCEPDYEFGFRLSMCGDCRRIVGTPSVTIYMDENQPVTYTAPCPYCGRELSLIDDIKSVKCPLCQEGTLAEQVDGMWD